jgi:sulfur carrier protein
VNAATASNVNVRVNEQPRAVAAGSTLQDLLRDLGLAEKRGIAVAVNDSVVPRSQWAARALVEGERVLVIQATQGG